MEMAGRSDIFINPHALPTLTSSTSTAAPDPAYDPQLIKSFHHSLPLFNTTPFLNITITIPSLSRGPRLRNILLKAESNRLNLPAFKILGASWGVYRSLCHHFNLPPTPLVDLDVLAQKARDAGVTLFAATDGNHGRAVARMGGILGVRSCIFGPKGMYEWTAQFIRDEGAEVVTVDGDYDAAVAECWGVCESINGGIMVQDNAFEGYDVVPRWISDGYGTMMAEVDDQFAELMREDGPEREITHVVTPIGVGSLGHAVVKWAKGHRQVGYGKQEKAKRVKVIAVEPETAACLNTSLRAGRSVTVDTEDTIMSGMCCGTVSPTAWKALKEGVDVSVTVRDWECHEMVVEVEESRLKSEEGREVEVGPCGAGCLVGLRKVFEAEEVRRVLGLDGDSVVVVLNTEGRREYPVPVRPDRELGM